MEEWSCPENCKKLPCYDRDHWGDEKYLLGHECPDDLGPDEPCPLAIYPASSNDKKIFIKRGYKTMANFKDMWDNAAKTEVKTFQAEALPDGTYITEVLSCKLGPTKAGDKDMVSWDLKVVQGDQKNSHIFVNRAFSKTEDSEKNMQAIERALNDFKILGLPCQSHELQKSMVSIVGKKIEISLKMGNSSQFQNFKRLIEEESAPEVFSADEVPFSVEEEKPF